MVLHIARTGSPFISSLIYIFAEGVRLAELRVGAATQGASITVTALGRTKDQNFFGSWASSLLALRSCPILGVWVEALGNASGRERAAWKTQHG